MTDTYESFVNYLGNNIERIRESMLIGRDTRLWDMYSYAFRNNFIARTASDFKPGTIAATDSSEFVRELYNGKKLILIRAFAKSREGTESSFICEVMDVSRDEIRNFTILLMEHTEHLATIRLLEKGNPDFVLMDGSLVGRLMHKNRHIEAEGYDSFMGIYFSGLFRLISLCMEKKIPLVFIAKSSESTIFRRFLLDRIDSSRFGMDELRIEKETKRTDHVLVKSFSSESGHTVPLLLSYPADRNITGNPRLNVVTFHALPDARDLPVKVDVVIPEAQASSGSGPETYRLDDRLMDMIFWGYGGLKTHNIWLADVDRDVKFNQKEVENLYMRTFEKMVGFAFYETRGERRARIRI